MAYIFQARTDGLGHARNAAAMASGRAAFETAPELPDDDEPSEEDARDAAEAEVLATPDLMANWLAFACSGADKPVDVRNVAALQVLEADVPTLLAVLLAGDDKHTARALHRLRELARDDGDNVSLVAARAERLMKAGAL